MVSRYSEYVNSFSFFFYFLFNLITEKLLYSGKIVYIFLQIIEGLFLPLQIQFFLFFALSRTNSVLFSASPVYPEASRYFSISSFDR